MGYIGHRLAVYFDNKLRKLKLQLRKYFRAKCYVSYIKFVFNSYIKFVFNNYIKFVFNFQFDKSLIKLLLFV